MEPIKYGRYAQLAGFNLKGFEYLREFETRHSSPAACYLGLDASCSACECLRCVYNEPPILLRIYSFDCIYASVTYSWDRYGPVHRAENAGENADLGC